MATSRKKSTNEPVKAPDALIVDKSSFTSTLIERIEKGKELGNRSITNIQELEANKSDFFKWDDYNSEYLKQVFNNEQNEYKFRYDRVNTFSGMFGGNDRNEELGRLKENIGNKVEFLQRMLDKVDLLKSEVEEPASSKVTIENPRINNKNVFIVHGHNSAIKESVARTISKLGLNPIILHEQPNSGKTIIEKFEANSNVGFAIILLTDDDDGKSKTELDLHSRARQNVVMELGFFIGKLGRDRVLPLYSEGVEIPSDIHGLLYVPIDKTENWKFSLVKELKAANYAVDANVLL